MKIINISKAIIVAAIAAFILPSCNSSRGTQGALLGAGAGAGLGAIIGNQSGNAGKGALIGAGAGALTGKVTIGDEQQHRRDSARLRELERREYERSRGY